MKPHTTLIIAGISGDLSRTKLLPALAEYIGHNRTHNLTIIGITRDPFDLDQWNNTLKRSPQSPPAHEEKDHLQDRIKIINFDLADLQQYTLLAHKMHEWGLTQTNIIVYAACPPHLFMPLLQGVVAQHIIIKGRTGTPFHTIAFEKPFGRTTQEAAQLQEACQTLLDPAQVARIDHFIAKDIVQSILYSRLTNRLLAPLWNKEHIAAISITLAEQELLGGRAHLYRDMGGVVTDVVQNHLMQLAALTLCNPPADLTAATLQRAKLEVLRQVTIDHVMVSTYEGADIDVPTYVLARAYCKKPLWQGVPIFLQSGKGLRADYSAITLHLRAVSCPLPLRCPVASNEIRIILGPESKLEITLNVKDPEAHDAVTPATLAFCYACAWPYSTQAYTILLRELFNNDHHMSISYEEIAASWHIIDTAPLPQITPPYEPHSDGPAEARAWYAHQLREAVYQEII